ncbi:MAG: hypothetical protein U0L09_07110 [Christensenellales bacterium]|nr:hypothetical protein [Christensenellales bacterium]
MRILERIAERNEDPGGQPPVLIAFLGDSVTHGCFELRLNGRGEADTVTEPGQGYPSRLKSVWMKCIPWRR